MLFKSQFTAALDGINFFFFFYMILRQLTVGFKNAFSGLLFCNQKKQKKTNIFSSDRKVLM